MKIDVVFIPEEPVHYANSTVIIIDVLRASSTIVTAFKNSAPGIYPVKTLQMAEEMHKQHPSRLLCGERGGVRPGDFHLGNSPREYSAVQVGGRELIFTTSNGTKAIERAREAYKIYIGCFLNFAQVVTDALSENHDINVVCAGNDGRISIDDLLCAGMMVDAINKKVCQLNLMDGARWAWYNLKGLSAGQTAPDQRRILQIMKNSFHGQKLIRLGFERDIEYCSNLNTVELSPYFSIDKLLI